MEEENRTPYMDTLAEKAHDRIQQMEAEDRWQDLEALVCVIALWQFGNPALTLARTGAKMETNMLNSINYVLSGGSNRRLRWDLHYCSHGAVIESSLVKYER